MILYIGCFAPRPGMISIKCPKITSIIKIPRMLSKVYILDFFSVSVIFHIPFCDHYKIENR